MSDLSATKSTKKWVLTGLVLALAFVLGVALLSWSSRHNKSAAPSPQPSSDVKCGENETGVYVQTIYAPLFDASENAANSIFDKLADNVVASGVEWGYGHCVSLEKAVALTKQALPLFNDTIVNHNADLDRRSTEFRDRVAAQPDKASALREAMVASCDLSQGLRGGYGDLQSDFYAYWHSDLAEAAVNPDLFKQIADKDDNYGGSFGSMERDDAEAAAERAATSYLVGRKGNLEFGDVVAGMASELLALPAEVRVFSGCAVG